jgi:hypothetical protein
MTTLFVICAAVGGSVMLMQFLLTVIGLGGEALDVDLPDGIDADVDVDVDLDVDAGHDGGTHVFSVLSFRTITAAMAFFGLGGLGAQSVGWGVLPTVVFAVLCALGALYAVFWLFQSLRRFNADGTARIRGAVGRHGTVYITIPEYLSGIGKIQLSLQNRTMEYLAQTSGEQLPPGVKIVVTDIVTPDTVVVESVYEEERVQHV